MLVSYYLFIYFVVYLLKYLLAAQLVFLLVDAGCGCCKLLFIQTFKKDASSSIFVDLIYSSADM